MFGLLIHGNMETWKLYWIKHRATACPSHTVKISVKILECSGWSIQMEKLQTQIMLYQWYSTGELATYKVIPVGSFWRRGRGETAASIRGKSS